MTVGSLAPAFMQILYRSAYAPHVATIPLKGWTPGAGAGDFDTWDGGSTPAAEYIDDFVALFSPFFPATVNFYAANIFTKADDDSPSIFSAGVALDVDGANGTPGNSKAVQATWVFSGVTGKLFKLVMLDVGNNNSFEPVTLSGLAGGSLDLVDFVTADDTPLSCRQDEKPAIFRQISYTLNAELQRQYHMN